MLNDRRLTYYLVREEELELIDVSFAKTELYVLSVYGNVRYDSYCNSLCSKHSSLWYKHCNTIIKKMLRDYIVVYTDVYSSHE